MRQFDQFCLAGAEHALKKSAFLHLFVCAFQIWEDGRKGRLDLFSARGPAELQAGGGLAAHGAAGCAPPPGCPESEWISLRSVNRPLAVFPKSLG